MTNQHLTVNARLLHLPLYFYITQKTSLRRGRQSNQLKLCMHTSIYMSVASYANHILFSESCTVDVLKYFCAVHGLSKAGKKAELVDRLIEDIQRYVAQQLWGAEN
jgi:hypothetical protein